MVENVDETIAAKEKQREQLPDEPQVAVDKEETLSHLMGRVGKARNHHVTLQAELDGKRAEPERRRTRTAEIATTKQSISEELEKIESGLSAPVPENEEQAITLAKRTAALSRRQMLITELSRSHRKSRLTRRRSICSVSNKTSRSCSSTVMPRT